MRNVCWAVGLMVVFLLICSLIDGLSVLGASVSPPEENTWVEVASMQQARHTFGAAVVEGKIYAIGGVMSGYQRYSGVHKSETLNTTEMYDPVANNWTYKAPMPTPSSGFAVTVFEDKIYCIGDSYTLVYNPALDAWENKTAMPIPRGVVQAHVVDGQIYVLMGYPEDYLNWVYDPLTDSWSQRASMPDGFHGYSYVVYEDKLYVIGAYAEPSYWETGLATNGLVSDGEVLTPKVSSMVQVYDPAIDVWSMVAVGDNLLSSRSVFLLSTSGIYAPLERYILYNPYDNANPLGNYFELGLFDWASSGWVYGESCSWLSSWRKGFSVVVLDDLVYVLGGYTARDARYSSVNVLSGVPQYAVAVASALVECYVPFGYGRVAPEVSVLSLEDGGEYGFGDVPLEFGLDRSVVWMGYSLDGQANVTVTGNVTLSELSMGVHAVRVFVEDEYGNVGASDIVTFSVASVSFPVLSVVAVVGVGVVVCACLFLLLRKYRFIKSLQTG